MFNKKSKNCFFTTYKKTALQSLSYPNTGKPILNGINFKISGTDKIAIVVENGSGKSTIIKLLLGLYRPNTGHIFINGYDISTISQKNLHHLFSVIFQDLCFR